MKTFATLYGLSFTTLLIIDAIWLNLMGDRFYKTQLAAIFTDKFSYGAAAVFYLLYCFGLTYLILMPAVEQGHDLTKVVTSGLLLGLIAYGAYDLTNQATIKNWPMIVTVVDMAWGTFVTGLAAGVAFVMYKKIM
jgi:uncharacterized membrane protein